MASGPGPILIFHKGCHCPGSWNLDPDTRDAAVCASLLPRLSDARDQQSEISNGRWPILSGLPRASKPGRSDI